MQSLHLGGQIFISRKFYLSGVLFILFAFSFYAVMITANSIQYEDQYSQIFWQYHLIKIKILKNAHMYRKDVKYIGTCAVVTRYRKLVTISGGYTDNIFQFIRSVLRYVTNYIFDKNSLIAHKGCQTLKICINLAVISTFQN